MSNGQSGEPRPKIGNENIPADPAPLPTPTGTEASAATPPAAALTPEEQMALYEKELKETDWGHQPC